MHRILPLLALLPIGCAVARPGETVEPSPLPERQWCLQDCSAGEGATLATALKKRGIAAQPLLLQTLREGPAAADRERVEQHARARYALRKEELSMPYVAEEVDAEILEQARSITLEAYVKDAVANFDVACRSRAISGLVVIGSRDAIPEIKKIAADANNPLNASARAAVEKLR